MHDGCSGSFATGQQVVSKLRMMGFSSGCLPLALRLPCQQCGEPMVMETFEHTCAGCGAVHGVTPCHAHSAEFVRCAGKGF